MHIPDGILPVSVCAAGYATTAVVTWGSLKMINRREDPQAGIPKASLLAAAFFVASWIHIPVPPTSVHLVLNGLLGVVLGWYAFPAVLIGLFFQAVMFQHGGLTTLGVNATLIGVPALLAHLVFQLRHALPRPDIGASVFGFVSSALAIGVSAVAAAGVLLLTLPADIDAGTERAGITALTLAHLPLMAIEGAITALVAGFLLKVKPALLESGRRRAAGGLGP